MRFSFYVCSWLLALSIVYPVIITGLFDFFIHFVELVKPGYSVDVLKEKRGDVIQLVILLQTVFMVMTFLISVFMSHKIAGPIYKLRKHLEMSKNGRLKGDLQFRKSDHFKELAEDYNLVVSAVQNNFNQSVEGVSTAIARIEAAASQSQGGAKSELEKALADLRQVKERLSG